MRAFAPFLAVIAAFAAPAAAHAADPVWISLPGAAPPVVTELRRDLDMPSRPDALWLDISADNRFILYVNGTRAATGPATSDLAHWHYERVNIAPLLKSGHNSLAAVVWNFVEPAEQDLKKQTGPLAQISAATAFYAKAEDDAFAAFNSGPDWRVRRDAGHTATSGFAQLNVPDWLGYYVAGAPETIDAATASWDWTTAPTDDNWKAATAVSGPWSLSADPLPAMTFTRIDNGRRVRGLGGDFPARPEIIDAHKHVQLLIERPAMVAAYPQLSVTGGKGAVIKLTYAEALYDAKGHKGVRDEVGDRHIAGLTDTFIADGGARTFETLHWRTWRFLQLDVTTGDAPLRLEGLKTFETGYPFVATAEFSSNDAQLNQIWQIGWRTARLDAHETYMDSAYWEQLQYTGDTRLQMLISYAVSGDARLAVNAIDAFGRSNNGGLSEGAYPSRGSNVIAPFSLLWVGMMHDYWMNEPDTAPIVRNLPRMREVLAWFRPYVHADGLLGKNPTWNFVDWVGKSRDAFPSFDANGESCLTSLGYLGALEQAADLEQAASDPKADADDLAEAAVIKAGVRAQCWDQQKQMFADDPSKTLFSQHANALAVLYDVATPDEAAPLLKRITARGIAPPEGVIPVSYYFSWYLVRAYEHAGLADAYVGLLQDWRDLLPLHFTTWPEAKLETRSDTHAWSGHPTADLLGIVAGIEPASPGYATVRIAPHLGDLKLLHVRAMTPSGAVSVDYSLDDLGLKAVIRMPPKLTGTFVWNGESHPLTGTQSSFRLK